MSKTWLLGLHNTEKVLTKKGGRTQLNARGSTRDLTILIDNDLLSHVK